jgi:putative ABC transport system permease protein
MIQNNFKIALRYLFRNSGFSAINMIGLGIGMAASILIALWIFDELSYDHFHENSSRIYRLEREFIKNGSARLVPITSAIYANKIIEDYPQVENVLRLVKRNYSVINEKNIAIKEKVFFADHSFFDVFSLPLISGDLSTILSEPNTLVLTAKGAKKYFGKEDPLNQTLLIETAGKKINYMVKGVMEDIPDNSHFHFDVLISFSTLEAQRLVNISEWNDNNLYTYLLLKEGTDVEAFQAKLQNLVKTYANPARSQLMGNKKLSSELKLLVQPITKIHFNNDSNYAIEPNRNKGLIYLFSFFSLLILLMASFNYVNLSTAIAGKRSLEVGVRKTMGAARKQLIVQFIGESLVLSIISLGIAFLIIEITLPTFNNFTDKSLSLTSLFRAENLIFILAVVFVTGFLSGLYPAFYLSSFKPIVVLKGKSWQILKRFNFRQVLVILQFSISIALIIGALTANLQMNYFRDKPLGFDRENVLIIPASNKYVSQHIEPFKLELTQQNVIESVSSSSGIPTSQSVSDNRYSIASKPGEEFFFWFYSIDENYFETYNIELIAGQDFAKGSHLSMMNKCIVNESLLKSIGISSPYEAIGKTLTHFGYKSESKEQIIGVVADYHMGGLDEKIKPMVHYAKSNGNYISVKYADGMAKESLTLVENIWKKQFPNIQFSSSFLETRYNNLYANERKIQQLLIAFTLLAIFIACMGLFGLAAFIVQQKTKEIGIRKVHGASNISIVNLLNGVFIKWVLIANLISWPIAYYIMDEWLAGFHYRVNLPLWIFILSGLMGLLIATLTVSYQASLAARSNPLNSLRFE